MSETKQLNVFDQIDYKAYLRGILGGKSQRKGLKSALAAAIPCQSTYVSQVLNGEAHFNLEQGTAINAFLGHTREEAHHFLLLLQKARAGNQELRRYFADQIEEVLKQRLNLTKRLGTKNDLNETEKTTFYSAWYYSAIHLALTVPTLRTKDALALHFRLPLARVAEVIDFLLATGLAAEKDGEYVAGATLIRIGTDSPHLRKHHSNWRLQALESFEREDIEDLHYSAVVSLSRKDVRRLKEMILENIRQYLDVIRPSDEEEVYSLGIDLFDVKRE